MTERVDLQEFVGAFVAEAHELVGVANAALLAIDSGGGPQPRAVRELFRALHTIKGLAGMIGVEPIVEIAHALETVVRAADRSGGQLEPTAVASCIHGTDAIAERVRAIAEGRTPARAPENLLEGIAALDATAAPPTLPALAPEWEAKLSPGERAQLALALARTRVWTVSFLPSDANASRGLTIGTVRHQLATIGEIIKVIPRSVQTEGAGIAFEILIASEAEQAALAAAGGTSLEWVHEVASATPAEPPVEAPIEAFSEPAEALGRAFVRVDVTRLDALQEQLSLLIVSRFRLQREIARHAERGHDVRGLREIAELQGRQLRDLRRAILQARMVRATEVLEPLSLLVRSLARSNHKDVKLELDAGAGAGGAELDKAVADRLLPALVHIIRNAVDHAIEPPEERTRRGKPRVGAIRVACRELAGSQIELTISDDGGGIDRDAVARRANRAAASDAELLDILATPGFSTRTAATQTSGRGLGMDIVRRIIAGDLGGEIDLTTAEGIGTTFTLRVPVTIAVLDVFSFECGRQAFVVPVTAVEEIFEVEPAQLVQPPSRTAPSFALLERRGRAVPVIALGQLLAIDDGSAARKALLIRRNGEELAFAVDRMLGRQEVVIRPIDDPLVDVAGVAGATDLGDGRPTLVLDLGELGGVARERTA